jgi:predicted peptidase
VKSSRIILVVAVAAALALAPLGAGEKTEAGKHGFLNKVYKDREGESKYVLFVPHSYQGDKDYPLILFLHGAGERGSDGQKPVMQGIGNAIKFKNGESRFPCFVIFPQCRTGANWQAGGLDAQRAMGMLDETEKTYKIDRKRVYLTGLSMGGFGTWSLAAAHPDRWAAIVPICGGVKTDMAADVAGKIKDIPCWGFCGDQDKLVTGMRTMFAALKQAGASPRYSEFPYVGHNSWDPAYVTPELVPWMLKQSRK